MSLSLVFCLLGPTASGKTEAAMKLFEALPCDLISVDSAMVYRGLDIGSAKPSKEMLKKYPHALIDLCDPSKAYSAAEFRRDAINCIEQSLAKKRLPVLVGGSMLYHHVLQQGLAELPSADKDLRASLQVKASNELYAELQTIDSISAARLHPHDRQRILRALEVYYLSGKTLSSLWQKQQAQKLPYTFMNVGLKIERALLRERLALRFHEMLKQGFLEEVSVLYQRGDLHEDLPAIKSVGYQQAWYYLQGKIDQHQMIETAIHASRQLAKRQMTWLNRWPNLTWVKDADEMIRKIRESFQA